MEHGKPLEGEENYPQDKSNKYPYNKQIQKKYKKMTDILLINPEGYNPSEKEKKHLMSSIRTIDNSLFIKGVGEIDEQTIKNYIKINNIEGFTPSSLIDVINLVPDYKVNGKNLRKHFLKYINNQKKWVNIK